MIKLTRHKGFSLIEVLLSMIIISTILVLMLPITTKLIKQPKKKTNAAIFTYQSNTNNNSLFPCYVTEINNAGNLVLTKNSGKCDSYEFYVPKGVHKIDLTMVAGGGGGGGASGEIEHVFNNPSTFLAEKVKKVTVKYLAGSGGIGEEATTSDLNRQSGNSGRAASMVYNYEIPLEKLPKAPDFFLEEYVYKINTGSEVLSDYYSLKIKEGYRDTFDSYGYYAIGAQNANDDEEKKDDCFETTGSEPDYSISDTINCINSPTEVNKGTKPTESDIDNGHFIISGAKEKRILPHISAGAGGEGASLIGINDSSSGWEYKSEPETPESPTNEGGEIEVTVAYPAAVASGGTAGTVIKINGLSVKPNEKYTIVVGSGGVGGLTGKKGLLNNEIKEYVIFPTNGEDGQGGSTTSIYKENGELLLMVAGGVGGYGGIIHNPDSAINSNAEIILDKWKNGLNPYEYKTGKAAPLPALPKMAAHYPLLIFGESFKLNKIEIDNSIIDRGNFATKADSEYTFGTEKTKNGAYFYNYKYVTENSSAIKNLTIDKNDNMAFKTYRAFADYHHLLNNDENATEPSTMAIGNIFKSINGKTIYNGLYFRYNPEGKDLMYAGGLGGFSAISPKAGCGGAFVGNYDGRLYTGDFDSSLKGTFTLTDEKGNSKTFFVNDYFDNCTINSTDGQSANFIPPQVSGSSIDFGQAGSGGGGGGWSKLLGSGKGGKGQDGYVIINWD